MANPAYPVNCPVGVWTKIATSVRTGTLWKIKKTTKYLQTYRLTGAAAPTTIDEAVPMFMDNPVSEEINNSDLIDVYVWCIGVAGILRGDL